MIEFVKGDKWCSWNGIVMTPEIQAKIFGIEEEPIMEEEFIIAGDSVYTDKDLGIILKVFGHKEENYPHHVLISKDLFNFFIGIFTARLSQKHGSHFHEDAQAVDNDDNGKNQTQ